MLLPFLYLNVSAAENENNGRIELVREDCFFSEDTLMIPFRAFCETLGAVVDWDNERYIANAYYISETCEAEVNVFMGEKPQINDMWDISNTTDAKNFSDIPARADMMVNINGECFPVFSDIPAVIINGRTYISSEIITETFGAVLIYDWYKIIIEFTEDNVFGMAQKETEKVDILKLINEARIKNGLNPLKNNITLDYVCGKKAQDKAYYKYFGHTSPKLGTPSDMFVNFDIKLKYAGECLYSCNIKVPHDRVFNAWMDSPGHRAIIMSENAKYIGSYCFTDNNGGIYWALLIAR